VAKTDSNNKAITTSGGAEEAEDQSLKTRENQEATNILVHGGSRWRCIFSKGNVGVGCRGRFCRSFRVPKAKTVLRGN